MKKFAIIIIQEIKDGCISLFDLTLQGRIAFDSDLGFGDWLISGKKYTTNELTKISLHLSELGEKTEKDFENVYEYIDYLGTLRIFNCSVKLENYLLTLINNKNLIVTENVDFFVENNLAVFTNNIK